MKKWRREFLVGGHNRVAKGEKEGVWKAHKEEFNLG